MNHRYLYSLLLLLLFSLVVFLAGWCYSLNTNLNSLHGAMSGIVRHDREVVAELEKEIRLLKQDVEILQKGWE